MKIVKKGRYILNAPWHKHTGKEVEIIMIRKGLSPSYKGKTIYHLAFDPDEEFRSEDLDDEFIADNFRPLEGMTCVLDCTMATEEIIERFKPYYRFLKNKMLDRINVQFIERNPGEPEDNSANHLCVFYLVDDGNGNPGLTLDKDGGEILVVEEEKQLEFDAKSVSHLRKGKKSICKYCSSEGSCTSVEAESCEKLKSEISRAKKSVKKNLKKK